MPRTQLVALVFILVAVCEVAAQQNASQNFSAVQFFLNHSKSNDIVCTTLTWQECNATTQCWYNKNTSQCATRVSALQNGTVAGLDTPWCYNYFPQWFIAGVYFVAAFSAGFAGVGLIYSGLYWDVYTRATDTGEVLRNLYYKKTTPIVAYCALILLAAGVMAITSWVNWNHADFCLYVYPVFFFIIALLGPAIAYPIYLLTKRIVEKCSGRDEVAFDLDKHVMPKTKIALADKYTCQTRCF